MFTRYIYILQDASASPETPQQKPAGLHTPYGAEREMEKSWHGPWLGHDSTYGRLKLTHTIWLFNIAMEHGPFIDDFAIKTSIYLIFHGHVK
jgi:hypothetical protein